MSYAPWQGAARPRLPLPRPRAPCPRCCTPRCVRALRAQQVARKTSMTTKKSKLMSAKSLPAKKLVARKMVTMTPAGKGAKKYRVPVSAPRVKRPAARGAKALKVRALGGGTAGVGPGAGRARTGGEACCGDRPSPPREVCCGARRVQQAHIRVCCGWTGRFHCSYRSCVGHAAACAAVGEGADSRRSLSPAPLLQLRQLQVRVQRPPQAVARLTRRPLAGAARHLCCTVAAPAGDQALPEERRAADPPGAFHAAGEGRPRGDRSWPRALRGPALGPAAPAMSAGACCRQQRTRRRLVRGLCGGRRARSLKCLHACKQVWASPGSQHRPRSPSGAPAPPPHPALRAPPLPLPAATPPAGARGGVPRLKREGPAL